MATVSQLTRRLSRVTGPRTAEVTGDALLLYARRALRTLQRRDRRLQRHHGVPDPEGLIQRMRRGELPEHPTWERHIEWLNLRESIAHWQALLRELQDVA